MSTLLHSLWMWTTPDRTLAIVAICFATKQYFDARGNDKKMAEHSNRMQDLGKSMSTRFIGTFPENMPEIKNVVDDAKIRLDIMVDYLGYGHFSSPAVFSDYLSQLFSKHRSGVKLRLIIYGENLLSQSNASEFPTEQYETLKNTQEFKEFFGVHCRGIKVPDDATAFRQFLVERQQAYLREAQVAGIPIRTVSRDLVIFLWLEDSEDAVFSFRGAGIKNDREVAFRTRDGKLIDTFSGLFEKIWLEATPLPQPSIIVQTRIDSPEVHEAR